MGYSGAHWPEGLNDKEAQQRLQAPCLGACDRCIADLTACGRGAPVMYLSHTTSFHSNGGSHHQTVNQTPKTAR